MQTQLDDQNIRIAAITLFLTERKKRTAHKYCRNPLAFLDLVNISSHVGNSEEFITSRLQYVARAVGAVHAART
jgi:hypothetical protein